MPVLHVETENSSMDLEKNTDGTHTVYVQTFEETTVTEFPFEQDAKDFYFAMLPIVVPQRMAA